MTGATGFLGTQTARRLLARRDVRLVVLVRGKDHEDAVRRLSRTWWPWPELSAGIGRRVEVLAGDVGTPLLGLQKKDHEGLAARVTHIIHCAADLRLDGPIDELRKINVHGTAEMLDLAARAHRHHGLTRFAHVSTAYVAGRRTGPVPEEDLGDSSGFSNTYEQTKFEGERLVRRAAGEFPVSVFRPGMIVGDSRTGEISTFNTVYVPLRLYLSGRLKVIPCKGEHPVNVVPVDYVADAVSRLTFDQRAAGRTFHLTIPSRLLPTARQLLESVRTWARSELSVRLPKPLMMPISAVSLDRRILRVIPPALISYFSEDRQFQTANAEDLLGPCAMDWKLILPRLLSYAAAKGFLHASGRTAPEQVLFRLQSRTRPVRFHEIVHGKAGTQSASQVKEQITQVCSSLRALGVKDGDRVAVAGRNGVRYLVLDVAIGLVGASSVPLYYTTPAGDMEEILRASESRFLFIGAPALLPEVEKMKLRLPTVSFCREQGREPVVSWDQFLQLGSDRVPGKMPGRPPAAAIRLSDEATVRYTSGTTGKPKGAIFRHHQVRWMAETLGSLLPWKARTRRASYLSFLPMSHVVEGILGTYAPYYLPAAVDIWFLEDFRALAASLPRVRPTVFFSVPRFYEKLWESFSGRPLGKLYVRLPAGWIRSILRPMVRMALLHRAGLNRCAQLISGSAPASPVLLSCFQELGITVHNAYGLTEAPLATLNRAGRNAPGTVGTLLPETLVKIGADGEVLLKGPQVTVGYDGNARQPFREGWLMTGDLGHMEGDNLVLEGRKKDLIVTSYGKNIHPGKIEAMLKGIPGITEAMVIGEGRPFCSALLWVRDRAEVDQGVRDVNGRLSHPEQIKMWSVLRNDLSIEGGELTGNLKLKRDVVSRRFCGQIESMYAARRT